MERHKLFSLSSWLFFIFLHILFSCFLPPCFLFSYFNMGLIIRSPYTCPFFTLAEAVAFFQVSCTECWMFALLLLTTFRSTPFKWSRKVNFSSICAFSSESWFFLFFFVLKILDPYVLIVSLENRVTYFLFTMVRQ